MPRSASRKKGGGSSATNTAQPQGQATYKTKASATAGKSGEAVTVAIEPVEAKAAQQASPQQTESSQQPGNGKAQKNGGKDRQSKEQQQQAQQQQTAVTVPQTKKQQQDLIIENYQELNKKFTELHMKMNSLQQQVKAQKDLQIQVEQTIAKAVKTALPEIVKKQVEETVAPLMQKQTEVFDQQIRQTLIPKIEQHLSRLNPAAAGASIGATAQAPVMTGGSVPDSSVRKVIHQEFKEAMTSHIMPALERELKIMLTKVKEPITNVNKIFYEKLVNEEQRSDQMVHVFEQRLSAIASQQQHHQAAQSHYLAPQQTHLHQHPPQALSQSFSLQPQASQSSAFATPQLAQPIAIYQSSPQPQYQIVMPQQQHGLQHFNVSQDQSMIANGQQQQQPLTMQLQPAAYQPQQQTSTAQTVTFGNSGQSQQVPMQLAHSNSMPVNSQFAPQQTAGTLQPQLQQQTAQTSLATGSAQQQLQPTNTSFVPTITTSNAQQVQYLPLQSQTTTLQQQNVQAPTFTPSPSAFLPTSQPTTQASLDTKPLINVPKTVITPSKEPAATAQASPAPATSSLASTEQKAEAASSAAAVIDTAVESPTAVVKPEVSAAAEESKEEKSPDVATTEEKD